MCPTSGKRSAPDAFPNVADKRIQKRPRAIGNESLVARLVPMLEFWLSATNLSHDRFLTNAMLRADGWVPVSLFVGFNKVAAIHATDSDVLSALRRLSGPPLEFATEGDRVTKVRIAGGLLQLKRLVDGAREDEDDRTIYVETLPADATREQVAAIFKAFGEVAYVSVPRFPGGLCKGFGFVEYRKVDAANKALKIICEGSFEVPRFPTLRALPRAEWRRRKEKYKEDKRAALVAATKLKARGASAPRVQHSCREEDKSTSIPTPSADSNKVDTNHSNQREDGEDQLAILTSEKTSQRSEPKPPEPSAGARHPRDLDQETHHLLDEVMDVDKGDESGAINTEPPPMFEHGLIMSITGLKKAKKRVTRRALFESLNECGSVAYIDYSPRTPDTCKVRFGDASSAQAVATALAPSGGSTILGAVVTASLLSGEDENMYWASIQSHREARKKRQAHKAATKAATKAARRVGSRTQPKRSEKGE